LVTLAWRTAYYGRVKHLPGLGEEIDEIEQVFQRAAAGEDDLSPERHAAIKERIRTALMAWNTKLARA
jgi:hypothetical protein